MLSWLPRFRDRRYKMTSLTFAVLTAAVLANAVGDVFMLWGVRFAGEPGVEAMRKTPDSYLRWGALSGLVTVNAWFLLVPAAAQLTDTVGWSIALSHCTYVAVTLSFHVAYVFVGLGVKKSETLEGPFSQLLGLLAAASFLCALAISVSWGLDVARRSGDWRYLAGTPTVTILFFQMCLGAVLRRVPYYQVVAGPLAMLVYFGAFFSYVESATGWVPI